MTTWTTKKLDTIGGAEEIDIEPRRADGASERSTTIWLVRVGDELYVRSYRGPQGGWYRAASGSGAGQVRARGTKYHVRFEPANDVDTASVDRAYRAKYGASSYVDAMVTAAAAETTMRLMPDQEGDQ